MDKLKNLINPGSKKDDEVMYGSGNMPGDPVHSGQGVQSGQGSHFNSSRTAGNDPLSSSTNPTTSTNTAGDSQYDTPSTEQGSHGLNEPYASRMPGGFDDDAATTASVRSGIPGQSQSGSNIDSGLNKPLPQEPAFANTGVGARNSLSGNSYPDRSVGSSGYSDEPTGSSNLGRDAALGAGAVGAGTAAHRHEDSQRDNYAPESGRSFPLGGSSKSSSDPHYGPGRTGTYPAGGVTGSSATGPHSSNLANKDDPRIDSDLNSGNTAYSASTATGYGSGTGGTAPSANTGNLGRDATLAGAGAGVGTQAAGMSSGTQSGSYGPESWEHGHGRHGHQYEGDPCDTGAVDSTGGRILGTTGPHITDTANLLDPHVAGGIGGVEHTSHRGEEAALAGGAGGVGLGAYEGDTTGSSSGTGSTGKTVGPHKSDMLNKMDPRVDSNMSKQQAGTSSGMANTETSEPYSSSSNPRLDSSRDTGGDHHVGRDAALGAGAGAGGLAYEAERHHGKPTQSSTIPSDTTGNAYGSTRDSSSYDQAGTALAGSGHQPATTRTHHTEGAPSQTAIAENESERPHKSHGLFGHHKNKDAAAAGGTGYEAKKLHDTGRVDPGTEIREHEHPGASIATYPSPGYGNERSSGTSHGHQGRDAAIGGAGLGGVGYEAKKLHDTGRVDPGTELREHEHPGASTATYPSSGYGNDRSSGNSHGHQGRDAAIGGAALGGAGYEAEKLHDPQSSHNVHQGPHGGVATGHDTSRDFDPSSNYAHQGTRDTTHDRHTEGKDAALVGGGAGAGALAGHEYSEKDAKHLQKEHAKEEKAMEKEHSKEMKTHDKEVAKHEKAIEKDEKKHEKAIAKEEKKHDHGGEKKHGGLLGLFHREKPDPAIKGNEAQRQTQASSSHDDPLDRGVDAEGFGRAAPGGLEGTTGGLALAGATTLEGQTGDSGIGSGMTTHDAYENDPNKYNKLHKDPPAKVLESRGL